MKAALFTPLPPLKSGTADYAAELIPHLKQAGTVEVISSMPARFHPADFDLLVYEIANNPHHAFCYDMALKHPGVSVLHETNLHHLIRELTVSKGNVDSYRKEVIYEIFGRQTVRSPINATVAAPQGLHLGMLRRLLDRSIGCVVHSRFAEDEVRRRGYQGPIARIPHGATPRNMDRNECRKELGMDGSPILGLFGYQRTDKRALECLEVFGVLRQSMPGAKLLIAGEPHPEVAIAERVADLGLENSVRILGHRAKLDDYDKCLAACDFILNFRWPTYGETSGTMMRAFALGRVVLVTDEGSCRDLPDDICLKIPHDAYQWDVVLEVLNWLGSEPHLAHAIGARAQDWVHRHCSWPRVAELHWDLFRSLREPAIETQTRAAQPSGKRQAVPAAKTPASLRDYLAYWSNSTVEKEEYCKEHLARLIRMLMLIPMGTSTDRVLEMGCYLQISPALKEVLGYGEVRGCYLGRGASDLRKITAADGRSFECMIDLFDAEFDWFPYPDQHFSAVVCGELLEHLNRDPMHMLIEIHRILKPDGVLLITTPNAASLRATTAILKGLHPGFYPYYMNPMGPNAADPRHAREYTPGEIYQLLTGASFAVERLETGPYSEDDQTFSRNGHILSLLKSSELSVELREECIFAVARKDSTPIDRLPLWLYAQ